MPHGTLVKPGKTEQRIQGGGESSIPSKWCDDPVPPRIPHAFHCPYVCVALPLLHPARNTSATRRLATGGFLLPLLLLLLPPRTQRKKSEKPCRQIKIAMAFRLQRLRSVSPGLHFPDLDVRSLWAPIITRDFAWVSTIQGGWEVTWCSAAGPCEPGSPWRSDVIACGYESGPRFRFAVARISGMAASCATFAKSGTL